MSMIKLFKNRWIKICKVPAAGNIPERYIWKRGAGDDARYMITNGNVKPSGEDGYFKILGLLAAEGIKLKEFLAINKKRGAGGKL